MAGRYTLNPIRVKQTPNATFALNARKLVDMFGVCRLLELDLERPSYF